MILLQTFRDTRDKNSYDVHLPAVTKPKRYKSN